MANIKIFETVVSQIKIGIRNVIEVRVGSEKVYPLQTSIKNAIVTCDSATYNAQSQTAQNIVVTVNSKTLVMNKDYIVVGNTGWVNVGTYGFSVSGIGDYTDSANATFVINKVTPTVTAPIANTLTYTGSAQQLAKAGSVNFGTLQYSLDDSTYDTFVPSGTNATSYTLYYKVVGDSNINDVAAASISCSIGKADPSYTAPTAKTGLTYTGSAQALLNAGSTSHGTIQYSSDNTNWDTTIPTSTNASTSINVYWRLVGDSNHNNVNSTVITCSITKADPTYTPPTSNSLTYNGVEQTLLNAGSTSHGTIKYSTDNSTWDTVIPTGKNATTYTSYWKLDGDANHNDVASTSIETTISKVTPTVTAPTAKSLTYTGNAQQLATAGSTNWGTLKYSLDNSTYSTSVPSGTNATSYTVYYRVDGDSNINNVAAKSISCSIAKANPTYAAPTAKSLTYNGNDQALLNTGSTSHGTIQYSSNNSTWSGSIPSGKTAGSYTSYWKLVGDANHNDVASTSISTTISKANGSVSTAPTAKSLTFNNANQELVNAGSGTGTMMYKLGTGSWDTSIPTASAATTYTVYYKASASTNYNESASGSVSVTINKVTPTVTAPTAKVLTFNNANQVLANAGSTNYGTIQYCLNNSGGTYSTTVPSASAANVTYKVWYEVVGNSNINDVAPASIDCSIAEKRVTTPTITLDPSSYTYNGTARKPTPTVKDGSTVIPSSEYNVSYSNNTNAGTATVTITDVDLGNYYISGTTTFTISKASGSVSTAPTAKSLTYNGSAQALVNAGSGTGTMMYKLDSGSWGTSVPTATDATGYTVYYKASASTNYDESASGSVSVTINKVTPTVTAPTAKSLTYNGSAQALVNAGSTNYGTLQYSSDNSTWGTSIPSGTNATSYTVYYRVVGNSNINDVASQSVACSIAKANTTYNAPTANNRTYDTTSKALLNAGSVTGGTIYYSSDNTNWSTTIPSQTNAGTYTTYWKITGDSNHNDKASASISTTVSPKTVSSPTITLSQDTYTYSNSACQPTPTVKDGSTTIASSEYTVSYSNNVNVGTATCTISDKSGGNYTVSGSKTFTISKYTPTPPTAKNPNWTGSAQNLVNAGSTSFGTMVYCTTSSGTFSTTIPTGTNAGSYEVWWKVTGNTNVNNTEPTKISCTINKIAMTSCTPTAKTGLTFTGSAQALVNDCTPTGGDVQYSGGSNSSYSTTVPTATNAGSYTINWKNVPDSNHSGGTTGSVTVTIAQAACCSSAPTAKSGLVYSGSAQALVNAGSSSCGTMQYCSTASGTYSTTIPTQTNAGTYTTYWKVANDSNHSGTCSGSVSVTIACQGTSVTTVPTAKSLTYSGSGQALVNAGAASTGGNMVYKLGSGSWSTSIPTATNAGSYTVYYMSSASTSNYCNSSSGSVSVTIANKAISIPTPGGYSAQYDGGAHTASFGSCTGASITKYRYSWDNSSWTESSSNPSLTNVGTLYTQAYYTAGSNYSGSGWSSSATLTVSRNTSATASNVSLTYNGTTETNGSSQTGVTGSYVTWAGTTSATNAGSYTAYATPTSNYAWSDGTYAQKTISWSIARRGQTAPVLNGSTTTYHNTASASVKTAGTVAGSTAAAPGALTWSNQSRTAVGSQTATAYYAATTTNFSASPSSAGVTVQINKATDQSITVTLTNRTYNTSSQVVASATSHGISNYYLGFGSSSTSAPSSWGSANSSISQTNAGTYYVWYKGTADGNHSADIGATYKGTVTIGKADQAAPTATGATTTYNTTATATASGGGGQGSIEWSNGNTQTSVGSKTTKARWSGNSNYNASPYSNEVTVKMNKADQSAPTATVTTATYPGTSTASASGGGGQGTLTWTNGSTRTAIGTATTKAYWAGNGNYNASPQSNAVTLSVAKFTPTVTLAVTNRAYNGNALYATASVATPSGGKTMKGTIYYGTSAGATTYSVSYGGSGSVNLSSVSVTNVGSATVYAYFTPDSSCNDVYNNSGNASKTFSVSKANQSAPTATGATVYYHNTATATASGGGGQGTLTWTNGNTRSTTGSQDTYAYWAGNSNYNASPNSNKVTLTVNKATDQSITVTLTNRTYNGSGQVVATATSHGCTYYLGFGSSSTSAPSSWGSANSSISQTNAGTYYVWYKGTADGNHSADIGATYKGNVTIACQGTSVTTAPTAKSLTYTGSAQALVNAGAASTGGNMVYKLGSGSWSTSIPTATNAGSYTVYYMSSASTSNYCNSSSGSVSVTIACQGTSVTTAPTAKSLTYTGSAQALVNAGAASTGGNMVYKLDNGSWSTSIPTATNGGSYTVYYMSSASTSNYCNSSSGSVTVTIVANYLTFTATDTGTFKFSGNSISYSVNSGKTWTTLASNTNSPSISAGSTIMWKGTLTPNSSKGIGRFSSTGRFTAKGNVMSLLYGDSYVGKTSLSGKSYAFMGLFADCSKLTSAGDMSLPATTLASYCYNGMFYYTSLTTAPSLPATTLADHCYEYMFQACTSLTSVGNIAATSFGEGSCYEMFYECISLTTAPSFTANSCSEESFYEMFAYCSNLTDASRITINATDYASCEYMFDGCARLTKAPKLPATTLAESCYNCMFYGCTSLTSAPVLPAETLVDYCYSYMFYGCTSLNYIMCLASDVDANDCTDGWVSGVASSGKFIQSSNMGDGDWSTGDDGIPTGWVKDYQPLTFTATDTGTFKFSGNSVNYSLDYGATWTTLASNTNSPSISAGSTIMWKGTLTPNSSIGIGRFSSTGRFTAKGNVMSLLFGDSYVGQRSLSGKSYAFKGLFVSCSKLTSASGILLPATTLASYCYSEMFYYCTSLITAPWLPATTLYDYCYNYMFSYCTSLTTPGNIAATSFDRSSCYEMFSNCTSLTTAPSFTVNSCSEESFYDMFFDCSNLADASRITINATDYYSCQSMFQNCSELTSPPKLPATRMYSYCYESMFDSCTSLTTAPSLPATTLASYCYESMFYNCTSLTTAPVLPATTLVSGCYDGMFSYCYKLNCIVAYFTTTPSSTHTSNWVYSVASSGVFMKASGATWNVTGVNGVPSGWTDIKDLNQLMFVEQGPTVYKYLALINSATFGSSDIADQYFAVGSWYGSNNSIPVKSQLVDDSFMTYIKLIQYAKNNISAGSTSNLSVSNMWARLSKEETSTSGTSVRTNQSGYIQVTNWNGSYPTAIILHATYWS